MRASEDSFRNFRNPQLPAHFQVRIALARIFQRDLQQRILHLLRSLHHRLHREGIDLAGLFIQLRAQVFLRLVVFARSHNNGIFHRANYNLRINPLLPAQRINRVVKLTSHRKTHLVIGQFCNLVT
jgi:hypothetical protein